MRSFLLALMLILQPQIVAKAQGSDLQQQLAIQNLIDKVGDAKLNGVTMPVHLYKPQSLDTIKKQIIASLPTNFFLQEYKSFGKRVLLVAKKLKPGDIKTLADASAYTNALYTISEMNLHGTTLVIGSPTGLLISAPNTELEVNHPALTRLRKDLKVLGSSEYRFASLYTQQQEILSTLPLKDLQEKVHAGLLQDGYQIAGWTKEEQNTPGLPDEQLYKKNGSVVYVSYESLDASLNKLNFQEIIQNGDVK